MTSLLSNLEYMSSHLLSSVVSRTIAERLPKLNAENKVNEYAQYLKTVEKCDLVIALTHIGYYEDLDFAKKTRNIDFIVGGHSHTFLVELKHSTNLDGQDVPIVTDGCWGLYVGELKIN